MHRLGIGAKKTAMIRRTSNIVFANAAAVFPASEDSSFITGIELSVDGGFTPVLAKHSKSFSLVEHDLCRRVIHPGDDREVSGALKWVSSLSCPNSNLCLPIF
jgi:hypothetical protein